MGKLLDLIQDLEKRRQDLELRFDRNVRIGEVFQEQDFDLLTILAEEEKMNEIFPKDK